MTKGMSRAEARAIWLKHVIDPDGVPASELAKTRNALIKKTHPDFGGNLEDAKLINAAYDVLKALPLDDASPQRQEQELCDHEQKRRQWEQYQRDYNEQRERESRYQEWVEKRAAQRRAEAQPETLPQTGVIDAQRQTEVERQHRWSFAKLCYQFAFRLAR